MLNRGDPAITMELDLGDLGSVARFARRLEARCPGRLDVLVQCAVCIAAFFICVALKQAGSLPFLGV